MSQTKILLAAVIATGAGSSSNIAPELKNRAIVASLAGTGAISATVTIEVSNDNVNWATRATLTLSGTTTASDTDVDAPSPFPYVRGNVTAIAGTGAALTLSVCGS